MLIDAAARYAGTTAWIIMAAITVATLAVVPNLSPYVWTWVTLSLVFLGFKSIVLAGIEHVRLARLGPWWLLGFVVLWPGMRIEPFLEAAERSASEHWAGGRSDLNIRRYLLTGLANVLVGLALFVLLGWEPLQGSQYLYALTGLTSVVLVLLFGIFNLLAAFWRWRGVDVHSQWRFLPASQSLAEYWSLRWNRAFHDFARDHVYRPLKHRWGSSVALLGSFLFSGLMHDLIISAPARGGFGLPTAYFLLQGLGIWVERRWIRRGILRRLWAWIVVLAPLGLLIHRPFVERVVLPQLAAVRGEGVGAPPGIH